MEISVETRDRTHVVTVTGRMDAVTAPDFEKHMIQWIGEGRRDFAVDFSRLDYISSAGLRAILTTAKKLKAVNGSLFIASLKGAVKEVFNLSGFASIIPIHDSVDAGPG